MKKIKSKYETASPLSLSFFPPPPPPFGLLIFPLAYTHTNEAKEATQCTLSSYHYSTIFQTPTDTITSLSFLLPSLSIPPNSPCYLSTSLPLSPLPFPLSSSPHFHASLRGENTYYYVVKFYLS